eukprot:scaffold15670_cov31-Tisochrysis_lutea.AAC.1
MAKSAWGFLSLSLFRDAWGGAASPSRMSWCIRHREAARVRATLRPRAASRHGRTARQRAANAIIRRLRWQRLGERERRGHMSSHERMTLSSLLLCPLLAISTILRVSGLVGGRHVSSVLDRSTKDGCEYFSEQRTEASTSLY